MRLQQIEITGFKSFGKKSVLSFTVPVTAVVGPNGSGKSNVVEAFRFVLGEQSMKSMRGKSGSDLIFRGGPKSPKLSRAAVSITFDNSDKVFAFTGGADSSVASPLLFDTVTFTREIFADGTSKYLLNGTEVRLKQMVELLSSVNIGTSSHHIISQGEADGVLRASPKDRREILEDALGLKIYHYRIKESENKLAKALDTLKDVQSLRREIGPHLKFLQKQVEKVEKGRAIRVELEGILLQYLATEKAFLADEDARLIAAEELIHSKLERLRAEFSAIPEESSAVDTSAGERAQLSQKLREVQDTRRTLESRMNRLEGMIDAHRQLLVQEKEVHTQQPERAVSFAPTEYKQLLGDISFFIDSFRQAQSLAEVQQTLSQLSTLLERLRGRQESVQTIEHKKPVSQSADAIKDMALEMESLERELKELFVQEDTAQSALRVLEQKREAFLLGTQEQTKRRYELQSEIKQCEAELHVLTVSKNAFLERKEYFDTELQEAAFLFGPSFVRDLKEATAIPELNIQEMKRNIDKLKIRLDEHSGIGNDVVTEYESTKERDEFLARETTDIESGIKNLELLIVDLKKVLDEKFTSGVSVINERFGEFFKTMFGGGSAFLSVTVEKKRKRKNDESLADIDEEPLDESDDRFFERGIDVHVNLPEKKVKELQMLSGGERSLVSIALLFAISQVNPPPFLVLDETDAALDEANSRRYGDMIERLSAYSQLIVVTHNRETMSRASVLYGVTLGSDSASKLLSIKFDEAVKVAK